MVYTSVASGSVSDAAVVAFPAGCLVESAIYAALERGDIRLTKAAEAVVRMGNSELLHALTSAGVGRSQFRHMHARNRYALRAGNGVWGHFG